VVLETAGSIQPEYSKADFSERKRKRSFVTGVFSGAPFSFQSGISSEIARGSITAPDRMCAPISEPFSSTHTERSAGELLQADRGGESRGPPPTMTTSYCIDSRDMREL
jgi:hypothetical protein